MANPIKTSDLYQNTGELKQLLSELEAVQKQLKELKDTQVKNAESIAASVKKSTVANAQGREEIEKTAKQTDALKKQVDRYNDALSDNAVEVAAVKNAIRTLNQVNKNEAKLLAAKEGSYNALSAQYSLNKIRLNQLSAEERKSTKAGRELEKQTKDIFEEMKRLQEATGKTSLNVGNYKESIKEAVDEMGGFPGAAGQVVGGVRSIRGAFKALLANPIVLFIAAITAGLAALFNAFTKSERGAKLLSTGTAVVSALLSQLTEISVQVVDAVTAIFEDPVGSLKEFGNLIVSNILNRFKAIPLIAKAAGDAIKALFARDLDALKAAGEDAFFAVNQAISGLDEQQQKSLADAIRETTNEITKEVDAFIALDQAKRRVRSTNRGLIRSIEQLTTVEQLARSVADDTTKSFKEREEAAEAARVALEKRAKAEIQLARNNLSLLNTEIDLRRANGEDVNALLDQQVQGYQQVAQAERELALATRANDRTRAELQQDRLERDLDILIDGFDNQKTINERRLKDERLTFEERKKIVEETKALSDASFAEQIATIQKFTGVQVNANELINESDAVALNQKIRSLGLSEIIEGRLLEIVRDRKTANQELSQSEFDLLKAEVAAGKKKREDAIKEAKELLAEQQAFLKSEFDLLESSEAEKTRFALLSEKNRLQKLIDINKELGGKLTATQIATYKNAIKGIEKELENIPEDPDGPKNIFELLGLDLPPGTQKAIVEAFAFAKKQILDLANTRVEAARRSKQAADSQVAEAQRALQIEVDLAAQGAASNTETARAELQRQKEIQLQAEEEAAKAEKRQRQLQTVQQAGNLITATTKIFSQVGNPLIAIPLVALMFGTFAKAKIDAAKAARSQQFGTGGTGVFEGTGSHATGDHIAFGSQSGTTLVAEANERWAVFNRKASRKYGNKLPEIIDLINRNQFENVYQKMNGKDQGAAMILPPALNVMSGGANVDMGRSEGYLSQIATNTQRYETTDAKGRRVVINGMERKTYLK